MATHGLTFLQIINRLLRRLRESEVAAHDTTDYSNLIGRMLNDVKHEIEGAFYWNALRDTYDVSTSDGVSSYTLTGAGDCIILSAWNTTAGTEMRRGTNRDFDKYFFGSGLNGTARGAPYLYLPAGLDVSYDRNVDLWPIPNGVYALKFNVYKQQADLAADATIPLVPQPLLIEETYARLLVERGDENAPRPQPGETFILRDRLAQEVAREAGHDDEELDWMPE
jgi:hypothetical protein